MSTSQKTKQGKSHKKTGIHRKSNRDQVIPRDSIATELAETRDRWLEISEIVDVTQVALEDGDCLTYRPRRSECLIPLRPGANSGRNSDVGWAD